MSVNTGINSALLKPQTFHVISYLLGTRSIVPLVQRLCLIGVQSAAATATAAAVVAIDDPTTIDAQFGTGSNMALMARKATEQAANIGQGPALFACPLAETTTKRVSTFTLVGSATADGPITVRIAGRTITTGVANGANVTTQAAALRDAINAMAAVLPVVATAAVGVVTCTDVCKGTLGNDVIFETIATPAGSVNTWVQTVAGAGAVDIQTALDAIAGQQFDGIAICDHTSANITEIVAQIATTWAASEKRPRWFFIGEPGSIATATTLATAGNHEGVEIINWQQCKNLPGEIAAAAAVRALSKNRPNANYDGNTLKLYPPAASYQYTNAQIETALNAGVTPLVAIIDPATGSVLDGVGAIVRLITSRTTVSAVPYGITRDFGISRTAWAMAKQYDVAYARIQQQAGGDGMLLDDDTIKLVRDTIIGVQYAAQDLQWIQRVDTLKDLIVIEADAITSGRLNADNTYAIVVGLHQVVYVDRAQVG